MADNTRRRVVITGMGLICPLGSSPAELWTGLSEGRSGIETLSRVPADAMPTTVGGEARQFTGHIDDFGPLEKAIKRTIKKGLKLMCREIEMGVAAAQRALHDASLDSGDGHDPERIGAVYGSDYILTLPQEFSEGIRKCIDDQGQFDFGRWAEQGIPEITPLWLLKYLPNMPASHIAIYNDLRGPNNSITLRESSGNLAIAEAYNTLVRGSADIMLAGATGTRIHPLRTIHVVLQEEIARGNGDPSSACRPFDLQRTGMVVGEGAAALVLETLESAEARGAAIHAEVVGHGSSTVLDRKSVAHLDQALANSMRQAIRSSGLDPASVGHIQAHGLSTRHCDVQESMAIEQVFADHRQIPVTATKSYFGNLGAGSGVVELISGVLALQHDQLFPVRNYATPDPQCRILVAREPTAPGDSFINCNVTPQGQASAVMVSKLA